MLRKFKLGGLVLGSLLALVGCQSEKLVNESSSQGSQMVTLTASRGFGSRTEMGENKNNERFMYWSADKLENGQSREQIFVGSTKDPLVKGILTLDPNSLKNDPTTGTFSGPVSGDPSLLDYSVYPVPNDEGKIDLTTRTGKYVDAPMLGEIKPNKTVAFENKSVSQKVPSSELNLQNSDFELVAKVDDEVLTLAATAEIRFDDSNKPYLHFTPSSKKNMVVNDAPEDGSVYVPFNLSDDNKREKVVFYVKAMGQSDDVALQPITGETNLAADNVENGVSLETNVLPFDELPVLSNGIIVQPNKQDASKFEEIVGDTGDSQNKQVLKTSTGETLPDAKSVTVGKDETAVKFTSIPDETNVAFEVQSKDNPNDSDPLEKVISFEEIPETVEVLAFTESIDDNLVDEDYQPGEDEGEGDNEGEGETPQEATQKVVVSLPESAANKAIDFNMPTSTVNVQSKSENGLTIDKVTAYTAKSTFIVGTGVTINKLVAMQGAIEVSGIVNTLTRGEGHKYAGRTLVTVKKGGKIPSNINKNDFEVEYEDGDVPPVVKPEEPEVAPGTVSTLEELMDALDDTTLKEITLKNPIDITLSQNMMLDFGFKTIKVIDGFWDKYDVAFDIKKSTTANSERRLKFEIAGAAGKWKIDTETTKEGKYLFKSNSVNLFLNNAALSLGEKLNAVRMEYAACALFNSIVEVSPTSYAVDVQTNEEVETMLTIDKATQIRGGIRFSLGDGDGINSSINIQGNSSINGELIVLGNIKRFKVDKVSGTVSGRGWFPYTGDDNTGGNDKPTTSEFEHSVANFAELKKVVESMQPVYNDKGLEQMHIIHYIGEGPLEITEPVIFNCPVHLDLGNKTLNVNITSTDMNKNFVFEIFNRSMMISNGTVNVSSGNTGISNFIYGHNQEPKNCSIHLHNVKVVMEKVMTAIFTNNMHVKLSENDNKQTSITTPLNGESSVQRGNVINVSFTDKFIGKEMLNISVSGTLKGDFYVYAYNIAADDETKYFNIENGQIEGNLCIEEQYNYWCQNFKILDTVTTYGYGWENITKEKTPNTGGENFKEGGRW